ncbi:MAG: hypothetical protein V7K21_24845 [Nostoc sp.]
MGEINSKFTHSKLFAQRLVEKKKAERDVALASRRVGVQEDEV